MTAKRLITGMLALLVIALLMAPSLMAQSLTSGDLTGTVTDPSGAVVTGATVTLKNNANGQTRNTTTNSSGAYRFSLLSPGGYTVTATASTFTKAETMTSINIGQATVADIKLAVGSSSTTVEVTSAAPLVQADNADLSTNFDQNVVANAPNAGNDLTYIAQTAPGINMNTGMGYGNFQTSGLPATSNVFTMNGENQMDPYLNLNNSGATNLMLGKNAVQEASVVTNAYGGQYGQQAGAQVNYVSKSGTNALHGNLQYQWTGASMDANNWFSDMTMTPKAPNNNNQWAASIGGPIKKDKLFFFVDTEGIRYIVPSTTTVFSPSPQFAAATLANLATVSPASLGLYSKAFSLYQAAPGYGSATPVSGGGCEDFTFSAPCFVQYTATPAEPAKEWLLIGRVDYNWTDKDHLFWSASFDHGTQATYADPINNAFSAASYQPQYNGQGEWTHTFGSNATNQFVYAGSYYRAIFTQNDAAATFPTWLDLGPIGYTSLANLEYIFPQGRNVTQYQFVDDFSLTKGNHNLKFGANFRRYDISDFAYSEYTNPLSAIFSVTDLYNGVSGYFTQNFPTRPSVPVALWGIGLYAQDEWRISKNLKLTFAMRAEHNSNPVCQVNCSALLTGSFYSESTDPNAAYNSLIKANQHQIFRSTDQIDWAP
ncbi:MAG: TonB-dependent receptor, partial [Candidatus Korobacteraceae bacterium]